MDTSYHSEYQKILDIVDQSGVSRKALQALLASGELAALLRRYKEYPYPQPTIKPIKVWYDASRTLVQMLDAGKYDYVTPGIEDAHFPPRRRKSGSRKLFLVCFHREMADDWDPGSSELLQELDKLGLRAEGATELCLIGEQFPLLHQNGNIVGRQQIWWDGDGDPECVTIEGGTTERVMYLHETSHWDRDCWFLASRKPAKRTKPAKRRQRNK